MAIPAARGRWRAAALLLSAAAGSCLTVTPASLRLHRPVAAAARPPVSAICAISVPPEAGDASRWEGLPMRPGSLVALVTPMSPGGDLDLDALRVLLRWHVDAGTDGIVALGTTGEASVLNMDERAQVLGVCQEELAGTDVPLMVGTGAVDPRAVIAMNEQALAYGADSCLVVTPYYVKPTQRGLREFFTTVADATALPLLLYNVPGRTAVDLKPETVAELSRHPRIFGIKEATGELSRVPQLRELITQKHFMLFSGEDSNAKDFTLMGGDGGISVTSNVAPAAQHAVYMAALRGDAAETVRLNEPLTLLHQRLFLQANPIPVKWAVAALGKMQSAQRLPLTELDPEFRPSLIEAMVQAELVPAEASADAVAA